MSKINKALAAYRQTVATRVQCEERNTALVLEGKQVEAALREAREEERKALLRLEQAVEDGE
jgi:sarcosine oxidase gamma subunit